MSSTAGIDPVVPLLLFVILFGLSMDYHVFIISRIREAFDRGASMDEAVAHGIKSTAGVVTSAALVMVSVFAIFGTLSMLFFKQFGVGLAAAVLIDATFVRAVLLPATMKLLGDRNWYLPGCCSGSRVSSTKNRRRPLRRHHCPLRRSPARIPAAARRSRDPLRAASRFTRRAYAARVLSLFDRELRYGKSAEQQKKREAGRTRASDRRGFPGADELVRPRATTPSL